MAASDTRESWVPGPLHPPHCIKYVIIINVLVFFWENYTPFCPPFCNTCFGLRRRSTWQVLYRELVSEHCQSDGPQRWLNGAKFDPQLSKEMVMSALIAETK